jgi:riboflavin kinase/FMN adenylyltransferase
MMDVITNLDDVAPQWRGACVAIGNFDGVHPGHQAVIRQAALPRTDTRPLGVVTFNPHPRRFFQPDAPPFYLTSLDDKVKLIGALGVDVLFALKFDATLAAMTAQEFVAEILVRRLSVAHVTIGHDFHFGKGRGGTPQGLIDMGRQSGFGVSLVDPVAGANGVFSSTQIRRHLADGAPEKAAALLGRPWSISGIVTQGDQRGRTINFPTANILLGDYLEPALGVYAVRITDPAGKSMIGVANLGRRPTFDGLGVRLETHIFDFDGDLYGQTLNVALIAFIRPERKFDGLAALTAQIASDAQTARALLS